MNNLIEAKHGTGIEAIIAGMTPTRPDERKIPATNSPFPELREQYERLREKHGSLYLPQIVNLVHNEVRSVLTPTEINIFLQSTVTSEHRDNYADFTGIFISRLIQNSYDDGNNNFSFNLDMLQPIHHLGYQVQGTTKKILKVKIKGIAGDWCGSSVLFSQFSIETVKDLCGSDAQHSKFNLKTAEDLLGYIARDSQFSTETVGNRASYDTFHNQFSTPREETVQRLLHIIPEGNQIIFLHPDGTPKIVRDYNDLN